MSVAKGGSVIVELPSLTTALAWNCGQEAKQAGNEVPFDVVRCERPTGDDVVWTFYRKI